MQGCQFPIFQYFESNHLNFFFFFGNYRILVNNFQENYSKAVYFGPQICQICCGAVLSLRINVVEAAGF